MCGSIFELHYKGTNINLNVQVMLRALGLVVNLVL
jgi:hypothetical protein